MLRALQSLNDSQLLPTVGLKAAAAIREKPFFYRVVVAAERNILYFRVAPCGATLDLKVAPKR